MCRIHTKSRPRPLSSLESPLTPASPSSSDLSAPCQLSLFLPSTLPPGPSVPSVKANLEDDPEGFSAYPADLYADDSFLPAFQLVLPAFQLVLPPLPASSAPTAAAGAAATSSLVTPLALEEGLDFNFPAVDSPGSHTTAEMSSASPSDYEVPTLDFGSCFQTGPEYPKYQDDSEDPYSHSSGIEMEDEEPISAGMINLTQTQKAQQTQQTQQQQQQQQKKKRRVVTHHPPPTTEEKRERNRLAAEKYRQKGRDTIAQLTEKCEELTKDKQTLLSRNKALESEVAKLRNIILKAGLAL